MAKLLLADEGERGAEPFVLDNRALIDLLDLVEGSVGQLDTVVADRKPAIGVIDDGDPLADRRLGRLQNEEDLVVLQGQRPRQRALLLPGKRVLEILARTQPPMQILAVRRRFGKARVVVSHEDREEGVAIRQSCRGSVRPASDALRSKPHWLF